MIKSRHTRRVARDAKQARARAARPAATRLFECEECGEEYEEHPAEMAPHFCANCTAPYVCPGCYAVGEECAPDCIDAEIARSHDDDNDGMASRGDDVDADVNGDVPW